MKNLLFLFFATLLAAACSGSDSPQPKPAPETGSTEPCILCTSPDGKIIRPNRNIPWNIS